MIYSINFIDSNISNSIEDCSFQNNQRAIVLENLGNVKIIRCDFSNNGGAIYLLKLGNISIFSSSFSQNNANYIDKGSAIYLWSSQSNSILEIVNSIFTENNSPHNGGAIYLEQFGNISITSSNFSNNFFQQDGGGGAISLFNPQSNSLAQIVGCIFTGNSAQNYYGGAIALDQIGNILINSSNFSNNFAIFGGGAIYSTRSQSDSMVQIVNSFFTENNLELGGSGGAIYFDYMANIIMDSNNFNSNSATFGKGSAIYLYNSNANSIMQIIDSIFIANSYPYYGGAIYMEYFGNVSINSSNFIDNLASNGGGAIYLLTSHSNSMFQIANSIFADNNPPTSGGAIYFEQSANISINSSNFSNNSAMNRGGAIYLLNSLPNSMLQLEGTIFTENNSTNSHGGALYLEQSGDVSINSSAFNDNLASNYGGGAICIFNSQSNSLLTIVNSRFTQNNSTNYYGGAIYLEQFGNFSINSSNFSNNYAYYGGGAIYLMNSQSNSMFKIVHSLFTDNSSPNYGGAIYFVLLGNISINSSNFTNNSAFNRGGGAIYLFSSQLNSTLQITQIANCVFFENNSTTGGGAIYLDQLGNISLTELKFSNNIADSGGAIFIYNLHLDSFQEISDCVFTENNSTNYGGALYMKFIGNFLIRKSKFIKSFAYFFGGAIFLFNSPSNFKIIESVFFESNSTNIGGAIYMQSFSNISIIASIFSMNLADLGSAIYFIHSQYNSLLEIENCIFNKNKATNYGGGIALKDLGDTYIKKNNFTNNLAMFGADIYVSNWQSNVIFEVDSNHFIENNSTSSGGTIFLISYGNSSIIKSNFSKNFAIFGANMYLLNSQQNSLLKITDCVFYENISPNYGGSLYMENYGNSSIYSNHFSKNLADFGAAIYLLNSQLNSLLEIADSAFIENNSTTSGGAFYMTTFGNTLIQRNNFSNNFAGSGGAIYSLNQSNK